MKTDENSPPHQQKYQLSDDGNAIEISGWSIRSMQGPIANTASEERLSTQLDIKLPSMLFDQSNLTLSKKDSKFQLYFDAVSALGMVGNADPNIKVKAAAHWNCNKQRSDVEITTIQEASDWTFSTKYKGTMTASSENQQTTTTTTNNNNNNEDKSQPTKKLDQIDYDALRDTSLPILFSSQVILFEDELDDNGTASYKVRIRVMPSFFFILTRFFLRVDSVLVRIYDVRYFHRFGAPVIVCETIHREASIPSTLQHLEMTTLHDPDILAPKVPITLKSLENIIV